MTGQLRGGSSTKQGSQYTARLKVQGADAYTEKTVEQTVVVCQGLTSSGGLVWRRAGFGQVSKLISGRGCLSLCLLCNGA